MKIVIVGGVAGGASAATRLRRLDESAEIVLLERGAYISCANCGLPYYVGGVIADRAKLTVTTPEIMQNRYAIDVRTGHEALSIDRERRVVRVLDRAARAQYSESYDYLILSPGAEPILPPIEGVRAENVFVLRSVPDAFRIKAFLDERQPKHALVVGGGAIGVELAENLSRAGLSVAIAEARDQVIAPLDYEMACIVQNRLFENGIKLRLGRAVRALEPGAALLDDGERLRADAVFLCAGVRPDGRLAREAGLPVTERGAIRVDAHMRTADERIYAIGDAAAVENFLTGEAGSAALAGPANKQGRVAADNICGIPSTYRGAQGSFVLQAFDLAAAGTGLGERAARAAGLDAQAAFVWTGAHAAYYPGGQDLALKLVFERQSGRLLGAQAAGGEGADKRIDAAAAAIRAGMTAYDLANLELCYAPPLSSVKDPLNQAACAAENLLTGKVRQIGFDDVDRIDRASATLLDVRAAAEFARGHIEGAVNIPLEALRGRMDRLDRSKPVYVNCQSGVRSYIACRMLAQHGYSCRNLSGGYRLYEAVRRARRRAGQGA